MKRQLARLHARLLTLATRSQHVAYQAEACGLDRVHVRDIRQAMFFFRQSMREVEDMARRMRRQRG